MFLQVRCCKFVKRVNLRSSHCAKSIQSCPTLCDPIDGSPPGSPVPGIFQPRTLEWVAISFSNVWKWKVKVKSLSHVRLFVTPWTTALPCPSPTPGACSNSCPSSWWHHPTISSSCHPLLFLPSIFPSIRVFSNESALHMRWSKYWSFSFSISPSLNIQDWFPLGWTGWISLQSKGLPSIFFNTTVGKYQFFGAQLSL